MGEPVDLEAARQTVLAALERLTRIDRIAALSVADAFAALDALVEMASRTRPAADLALRSLIADTIQPYFDYRDDAEQVAGDIAAALRSAPPEELAEGLGMKRLGVLGQWADIDDGVWPVIMDGDRMAAEYDASDVLAPVFRFVGGPE